MRRPTRAWWRGGSSAPDTFARLTPAGRAAVQSGALPSADRLVSAAYATVEVARSLSDPQALWMGATVDACVRRGLGAPPSGGEERRLVMGALSSLALDCLPPGHDARLLWLALDARAAARLDFAAPERARVRGLQRFRPFVVTPSPEPKPSP